MGPAKTQLSWNPSDKPNHLRCSACEVEFRVGRSCGCKSTASASPSDGSAESRDSSAGAVPIVGCYSDADEWVGDLPNVDQYERMVLALLRCQSRLRDDVVDAPVEDEHVTSADGRRGTWRQAWLAEHSKLRLRKEVIAEMRKTLGQLVQMAEKREMPETVKRYERLAAALQNRHGSRRANKGENAN